MKPLILLILSLSMCECGAVAPQGVQNGVVIAESILDVVEALLKRVETARSSCDWLTRDEDRTVAEQARFTCAEINDAAMNVIEYRDEYLADSENSDAEAKLRTAADELKFVLDESGLAK